jgi:hypothetical protein
MRDMEDAWSRLQNLQYTCRSDVTAGDYSTGFMVSKDQATHLNAAELCKSGPMDQRWQGKVWVTVVPNVPDWPWPTMPDDAGVGVWGRVLAFGVGVFLDELERNLQDQHGSLFAANN